jgi:uncharacterized protein HemX
VALTVKSRASTLLLLTLIAALVVTIIVQAEELAHRTDAARLREEELVAAQTASQSAIALKQMQDYTEAQRKEIQRLQAQTKSLESQVRRLKEDQKPAAKTDK